MHSRTSMARWKMPGAVKYEKVMAFELEVSAGKRARN